MAASKIDIVTFIKVFISVVMIKCVCVYVSVFVGVCVSNFIPVLPKGDTFPCLLTPPNLELCNTSRQVYVKILCTFLSNL